MLIIPLDTEWGSFPSRRDGKQTEKCVDARTRIRSAKSDSPLYAVGQTDEISIMQGCKSLAACLEKVNNGRFLSLERGYET